MTALTIARSLGRDHDQLRPLSVVYDIYEYAAGSVLISMGKTRVLCAVTLENGVPPFLRGKGTGWLSAEYSMLPPSTQTRSTRETGAAQRNGRSVEISRLIGRALRAAVNVDRIGERTILVDCDVLQADGGTRSASITGAFCALELAQTRWLEMGIIKEPFITHRVAGLSVGIVEDALLLDPDYKEDSQGSGDINFVMTSDGSVVEVQGGAEKQPLASSKFSGALKLATHGMQRLFQEIDKQKTSIDAFPVEQKLQRKDQPKLPLFSLKNRLSSV